MKALHIGILSGAAVIAGAGALALAGNPTLAVGDAAPDFTARTNKGDVVELRQFREKKNVVLYFYPKDFTAGCTAEACAFRDSAAELASRDAVIIGVSFDSRESHERFAAEYHLPFILVSDPDRSISRLYGATWFWGLLPFAKRVTYLIDKEGIIRAVSHHELAIGNHLKEMMDALAGLQRKG